MQDRVASTVDVFVFLFQLEEDGEKDSVQPNEETENIPPITSQSTTKKRRLFRKPSSVAASLSPAKTVSS